MPPLLPFLCTPPAHHVLGHTSPFSAPTDTAPLQGMMFLQTHLVRWAPLLQVSAAAPSLPLSLWLALQCAASAYPMACASEQTPWPHPTAAEPAPACCPPAAGARQLWLGAAAAAAPAASFSWQSQGRPASVPGAGSATPTCAWLWRLQKSEHVSAQWITRCTHKCASKRQSTALPVSCQPRLESQHRTLAWVHTQPVRVPHSPAQLPAPTRPRTWRLPGRAGLRRGSSVLSMRAAPLALNGPAPQGVRP